MEACCQDEANRSDPFVIDEDRPELTVTVCRVCGRRHFELDAEAGFLSADLKG